MTEREFKVRYRELDAVVVQIMWGVWKRSTWDVRGELLTALDRLAAQVQLALYAPGAVRP